VVVLKRLAAAVLGVPRGRWPLIIAPLAVIGSVLLGHPLLTLAAVLWLAPRLPLLLFFLLYPEALKSQDSAPSTGGRGVASRRIDRAKCVAGSSRRGQRPARKGSG
jgi:hypothetical protein